MYVLFHAPPDIDSNAQKEFTYRSVLRREPTDNLSRNTMLNALLTELDAWEEKRKGSPVDSEPTAKRQKRKSVQFNEDKNEVVIFYKNKYHEEEMDNFSSMSSLAAVDEVFSTKRLIGRIRP